MTIPWIRPLASALVLTGLMGPLHAQSPEKAARPAASPTAGAPAVATPVPGPAAVRAAAPSAPRSTPATRGRAMDRVELEASRITGNRELPRVMYVVPWRQPGAGEVDGRPVNSLLYELSSPVDREVTRRELRYGQSGAVAEGKPVP